MYKTLHFSEQKKFAGLKVQCVNIAGTCTRQLTCFFTKTMCNQDLRASDLWLMNLKTVYSEQGQKGEKSSREQVEITETWKL